MKLIIDTNILFSYFWKATLTKRLIKKFKLYAPEFALKEIKKYKEEIKKKTKITEEEFKEIIKKLKEEITFKPTNTYAKKLKQAHDISPDPNDIDFFALALTLQLPLWTNDKALAKQKEIIILTTKEIVELIGKKQ